MSTVDVSLAGGRVGARLYRSSADNRQFIVYLHGGGWTIGGVSTYDRACRRMATTTGASLLSVDYRLAPEYPAPAAIDDAIAALESVASSPPEVGARPHAIAVAGDSAGGTLAALAALQLRGTPAVPDLLLMAYANTHLGATSGSMASNAHGFGLDAADVAWFNRQWVPDLSRHSDPAFSPLLVGDLRGAPETIIVTCELDPLRDQGEAFGNKLVAAGVPVLMRRELGMVHNFLLWDLVAPACSKAADRVAGDLVNGFARVARKPLGQVGT
jgi:acetyl esterase